MKSGRIQISKFTGGLMVFTPDYYLNIGKKTISDLIDKGIAYKKLNELSDKIYQGGIFKRVFNVEGVKAYKYITASDMVKSQPLDTAKNISKKFTPWINEMTLNSNQILVSCAGTVGNSVLVNDSFAGCIGSQEIIRVESSKIPFGYIYAYLSTPLVYEYIQSMIYGAVVPRISPEEFGNLPILLPSKSKQEKIHNLIVEASTLRVEANKLLRKAQLNFDDILGVGDSNSTVYSKKSRELKLFQSRLDASFNIQKKELDKVIDQCGVPHSNITRYLKDVFIPNRGKRIYVKKGLKYLSTSDISTFNPTRIEKFLSLKMKGVETLKVKKHWVLVARSGQDILGTTFFVGKQLNNLGVNEHALRVVFDEEIAPYIYAFLSSKFGKRYLRAGIFGSAILTINDDYIRELLIPELDEKKRKLITELVVKSTMLFDNAMEKENQAINLVEKEIESWQKS